jgi:ABC-type sugar transport system permease subunit
MEQTLRQKKKPLHRRYRYTAYLWLLPALVLCALFCLYPVLSAFWLSFTNATSTGVGKWIGFGNYVELFHDPVFWTCMKNVLIFTVVGLVCGNAMTVLLSELLYNLRNKKFAGAIRFFFVLPVLVPFVVIILVWRYIIFSTNGLANALLTGLGGSAQNWYFGLNTDMLAIILTNFPWVGGTSFLIYLAGLQEISPDIIEASKIDGCSTFRRIFAIDLPLIKPQFRYFLIMGIIGGLQNFDLQLLITGSGVGTTNSVNVPGYYIYDAAFLSDKMRFGYASAVGVILFLITMVFTIVNLRQKKKEED